MWNNQTPVSRVQNYTRTHTRLMAYGARWEKWRCKWKNQNQKVIVKVEKNQNITFTEVNDHKITETKEHTQKDK
jgi:hypothetical protein